MKVLLFDLDGIVIAPRDKYFSQKFAREYNLPWEKEVLPFFTGVYKKIVIGEISIKKVLPEYLKRWKWKGSVDEFLQYWFESERDVDERVLEVVSALRKKGIKCCLASDNEKYRAEYLLDKVDLRQHFDDTFFSCHLGCTKSNPEFFEKIVEELEVKPEEIEYWDDDPDNVKVAQGVGIKGNVYEELDKFKEKVMSE